MTPLALKDISSEYMSWLKDNLIHFNKGDSQVLSTPFLNPFNDGIELVLDTVGNETILHDGGATLDNLLDMGVQIDNSERRQSIIQHAIAGCGVNLNNNRLETVITHTNKAQRMHFLTTAILRLNDLWMTSTPRNTTDFFEIVKEYFDNNEVLYTANKSIIGKTVEHPIDFIIPLPKGKDRLIKLISRPNLQAAKVVSFTWFDLRESQPDAERIVLLNDFAIDSNTDETPKQIQQNIISILNGYSNKVINWSDAQNDDNFTTAISK